jgi:hypothetical protein
MADLSVTQALEEAKRIKDEFNEHHLMRTRRRAVGRQLKADLQALGIQENLRSIVPYETDIPNQEARQYATALSLPRPEVAVVVESEQATKRKGAERLEAFYQASLQQLVPDDYDVCRNMAMDGYGVRRMDEVQAFFKDSPKRDNGEEADPFMERVDEHRRGIGLPLRCFTIDPMTFYFVENLERTEVIFGVEWVWVRESDVKEDGSFTQMGEMAVVRTKDSIRHFWLPDGNTTESETVFEGENRFGHTGYILYRGLYTGLGGAGNEGSQAGGIDSAERRYDPFAMVSINQAQHRNLFMTLQASYGIQAGIHWLESDLDRGARSSRAVSTERKAKGRGANVAVNRGTPAAEFEPGTHVMFRNLAQDAKEQLARLDMEDERYRFRDVLMGEASSDASGRAIIRLQEAAGRQLAPGYRARQLATEEILKVVRRTFFGRTEYLGGSSNQHIFIPHLVEGLGESSDWNKSEIISIEKSDNMPHDIKVTVEAMTQAAQLAWIEEGLKLEGTFPRDTIDQEFYKMKNIPLQNRRRIKDQMREAVIPTAVQDGASQALEKLGKIPIQQQGATTSARGAGGARPGESGMGDAPRPEDAALSLGA